MEKFPSSSSLDEITSDILKSLTSSDAVHPSRRALQSSFAHTKQEAEQTASDSEGLQGGQQWRPPTLSPTFSPTYHPTPHGEPFVLKGTVWCVRIVRRCFTLAIETDIAAVLTHFVVVVVTRYDRNANGRRDAGLVVGGMGSDVEWIWGLGEIQSDSQIAATISLGYNSKMEPMLSSGGGVYRLVNIKVDRSYAVRVEAPDGYLFTNGVCNDNVREWKCKYSSRSGRNLLRESYGWFRWPSIFVEEYEEAEEGGLGIARGWFSKIQQWMYRGLKGEQGRRLAATTTSGSQTNEGKKSNKEYSVGIPSGRSATCITVDRFGIPDQPLDFGVMRIGDSKAADTDVALVLNFDDAVTSKRWRNRELKKIIAEATELPREEHSNVRRYLLAEKDKSAIGSVTAEVLASRLDQRLAENQIVLDAVVPRDVILSANAETSSKEVAVALNIQGHYSPPPELDFEYIVNDSINSDTDEIRRNLRDYNQNCRDQAAKVQSGSSASDFNEVHSLSGATSNRGGGAGGDVYRCAEGEALPAIFETSLKEIQATKVSEIMFHQVIYEENEEARLESWAMGPLAAVTGLIAILMGVFLSRRAFGPRKVDHYRKSMKTRNIDSYEQRRFGEMGGDLDDGSVDSAFYSDADEDDFKEGVTPKDKERRMRRKLREAEKRASKGAGKSSRNFRKSTRKLVAMAKSSRNVAVKSGSADETDSVPSGDTSKDGPEEMKRSKRSTVKEPRDSFKKSTRSSISSTRRSSIKSSTKSTKSENLRSSATSNKSKDSSKKSSSRRGRDKREGGDNARVMENESKKSFD
ncbi:hypothetical protein ACHAWX_003547 [Stephanocyclus meneghinianus]